MLFVGCSSQSMVYENPDISSESWVLYEESADGTRVVMAYDFLEEHVEDFLTKTYTKYLKSTYNVELRLHKRTYAEIIKSLEKSKAKEEQFTEFDILFLSGEGVKKLHEEGYLYEGFIPSLPNYYANMNPKNLEDLYVEDLELGASVINVARTQLFFIHDEEVLYFPPENNSQLVTLINENPGKITFPDPRTSLLGEAFVTGFLTKGIDAELLYEAAPTMEAMEALVADNLAELKSVTPNLYGEGKSYPKDGASLDQLFSNGELLMTMTFELKHAANQVLDLVYPESAMSFALDDGTTGYNYRMMILNDASNKAGAVVAIDGMLSPEMQGSMYSPRTWGVLPVYDREIAPSSSYVTINETKMKRQDMKEKTLLERRLPEMSPEKRRILLALWERECLGNKGE